MPISKMGDIINRMAEVHRVPRRSTLATLSLFLSLVFAMLAVSAGFGTRINVWNFRTGLTILEWAVLGAGFTVLTSLIACWITLPLRSDTRGFTLSLIALAISSIVVFIPVKWKLKARTAPPIHDITTDLEDPPRFRVIPYYRKDEHNDLTRSDTGLASIQKQHYDLNSLTLNRPRQGCMKRALQKARELDWILRSVNWKEGHIEATDTTFWFGFKDDVAVRITSLSQDRCVVDVRSVSRHGQSDLGKNARRIRKFLDKMEFS